MKGLLLSLLAALALPIAVNAQVANYYLLAMAARKPYVVPMASKELCELAGSQFVDGKAWSNGMERMTAITYLCVKAK